MCNVHRTCLIGVAALLVCGACERKEPPPSNASAPPTAEELARVRQANQQDAHATPAAPTGTPTGLPPGHPPIGGNAGATSRPALPPGHPPMDGGANPTPTPAEAGPTLIYDPPSTWIAEQPAPGGMVPRAAQFRLPRAAGDPNDGDLAVFLFGGAEGGPVDTLIDRWRLQFVGADGQPVPPDAMKQETFKVSGLTVHFVDVTGRYRGMSDNAPAAEQRLLGAVVELKDGKAVFKAVGPTATMAQHRDAFRKMLDTLKVRE